MLTITNPEPNNYDVVKIDINGKYILIFDEPVSHEEMIRFRDAIKKFLEDENEHFLLAYGIQLEKING